MKRLMLLMLTAALAGVLLACGGAGPSDDRAPAGLEGAAARGQSLAQATCLSCHTTNGTPLVGPTFKGLYGSTVELRDGTTVVADEDYLRESIVDPGAKVVAGYNPSMPSFRGVYTEEQIDDLVAYIKSLE